MKKTALYDTHIQLHAKMTEFSGFDMPLSYSSITEEHFAVRNHVGIFDVSHMGNIFIEGKDALDFVNYLVTNLITNTPNKVTYALLTNDTGHVIDDLLVYMYHAKKLLIVCNASNIDAVYTWICSHQNHYKVTIQNSSETMSQIAIQGPKSESIVKTLLPDVNEQLLFMTFDVLSNDILVSRTGYTGEDGFELYGSHSSIRQLFQQAIALGVTPIGLGARDTLRFEAALPLYGHELSLSIHPYEASLSFAVKDKTFIGSDALKHLKDHTTRQLVALEMLDRGIPRADYSIYYNDIKVGYVTTGYMLPGHQKGYALALIQKPYHKIGTQLFIDIRGRKLPVQVIKKSFMIKKYKKEQT